MKLLPFATLALSLLAQNSSFASTKEGVLNEKKENILRESVSSFIGSPLRSTNIHDLYREGGKEGEALHQPWSGSYWPLDMGSIASRYSEGKFLGHARLHLNGDQRDDYYRSRISKLQEKIATNKLDEKTIESLSPSEKYDLFIGDTDFTLTHSILQSVREQYERLHGLKRWEGSCQGWASAAAYAQRPVRSISVPSLDGKYLIPFFPDDLKALQTLLWAHSLVQDHTRMSGNRCLSKNPNVLPKNGKVTDLSCKGVNPGIFHASLIELVGKKKTSFIINRVNNDQVWNQPVAGYQMKYFNPETKEEAPLEDAILQIEKVQDPFQESRDSKTKYLVGVVLELAYTKENEASHEKMSPESKDSIKKLHLRYDLELDQNMNVLGGEWLSAANDESEEKEIPAYPGFMWKFKAETPIAFSIVDFKAPNPGSSEFNPETLVPLSKLASQFRYHDAVLNIEQLKPQPIGKVVNFLVSLSGSN